MKMTRIYPKSLVFTPASGTAVTLATFQDAATFNVSDTYTDSTSQSDLMLTAKYRTGHAATLRVVAKAVDTKDFAALIGADYDATTQAVKAKVNFDSNYGSVTLVGYDTEAKTEVTIKIERTVPVVNGDLTFGKEAEVTVGVEFSALTPLTAVPAYSITPASAP